MDESNDVTPELSRFPSLSRFPPSRFSPSLETELAARYDRMRFRSANAVLRHANLRKHVPVELHE